MYKIGQVIFVVTVKQKTGIAIVPVRVVGQSTEEELVEGKIVTKKKFKVETGNKTYDLSTIKGSQFSSLKEAVDALRAANEKKLQAISSKTLRVAQKHFGYTEESGLKDVDLDSPVYSEAAYPLVPDSAPEAGVQPAQLPASVAVETDPGGPKTTFDKASIDKAFAKQTQVSTTSSSLVTGPVVEDGTYPPC